MVDHIINTLHHDMSLAEPFIFGYFADFDLVKAYYPELSKFQLPELNGLLIIRNRFLLEVVEGGQRYPKLSSFLKKTPILTPDWINELQMSAKKEALDHVKFKESFKAQHNQKMFDPNKARFVRFEDVPLEDSALIHGKLLITQNHMEKPPESILYGFDTDSLEVEYTERILDIRGHYSLPRWTIRINGDDPDPILSCYFGYVPDGIYLLSQHNSREDFEHRKLLTHESLAFLTTMVDICSRIYSHTVQQEYNFDELYDIRHKIANGLPVLYALNSIVNFTGFESIEAYWAWYQKVFSDYLMKQESSVKFLSKYPANSIKWVYNMPIDGLLGINAADAYEIDQIEYLSREPVMSFKWHDEHLYHDIPRG